MVGILWSVEVYRLSTVIVCVVSPLLIPMCSLLWSTLSRIPGTASILVFCGVRGVYQFHILFLL